MKKNFFKKTKINLRFILKITTMTSTYPDHDKYSDVEDECNKYFNREEAL